MDKQAYKIDSEGYLIDVLIKDFDSEGNCTEELAEDIITTPPPQGFNKNLRNNTLDKRRMDRNNDRSRVYCNSVETAGKGANNRRKTTTIRNTCCKQHF